MKSQGGEAICAVLGVKLNKIVCQEVGPTLSVVLGETVGENLRTAREGKRSLKVVGMLACKGC